MKVMSGLDARFLFSETRSAHMHTIKVAVVDVSARPEALTADLMAPLLSARIERLPVLRRRVLPVPHGLGNPVVIDDPDFDVRRHLAWVTAAPPGGPRELADVVARVTAVPLPRDRPMWELTVVDGLADDQVAFVVKIHHALADGVAAVALLTNTFATDDADPVVEPFRPEPVPSDRALYAATARSAVRALRSLPRLARGSFEGLRAKRAIRRDESTPVMGPFAGPRTPFNVSLTPERTFATTTLPLETLNRTRRPVGASFNDAFLTVCSGGIRRYLQRTDDLPPRSLVASVPVATRTGEPRLAGNHVDNLFLPLHTDIDDPIERLIAIHASTVAARRVRTALGVGLFEHRAGFIPPFVHMATTRTWAASGLADRVRPPLNLIVSCVPGPSRLLELDGGVITAIYSSGPILEGIGLNITAWSYGDELFVSLLGCPASLPDPWLLAEDIDAEMEALARRSPVTEPAA